MMLRSGLVAAIGLLGIVGQPPVLEWPGGAARPADASRIGGNISGLATDATGRLWAVRDRPSELLQLERTKAGWTATPEWPTGRALRYSDPGANDGPDAEGITTVPDEPDTVYVAAERDNANPGTSRNSVLRYQLTGSGPLIADAEWRLDDVLPTTPANTGIEGVTFVPDTALTAMGLQTSSGELYRPDALPPHGSGLFAVGVETSGDLTLVALHQDGTVTAVTTVATGLPSVMDLSWNQSRRELWVLCDNACDSQSTVLAPGAGTFEPVATVKAPTAIAPRNSEGFALAACDGATMTAVWSDDSADGGVALREATLPCEPVALAPLPATTVAASASTIAPPKATTTAAPAPVATPTTTPTTTTSATGPGSSSLIVPAMAAIAVVAGATAVIVRRRRRQLTEDSQ